MKIVLFTKNGQLQALVQFYDAASAKQAMIALDGKNVFLEGFFLGGGSCNFISFFSELEKRPIKYNIGQWNF